MIAVPMVLRAHLLALLLGLAACSGDDASGDVPAPPDGGDAAPVCRFTGGAAPENPATTFPCALAPAAAPWGDCPARFPATSDEITLLCRRSFQSGPATAAAAAPPDAVLAGTCAGQKVVILNISPGHGIQCHYAVTGLVGAAYYDDTNSYCDHTSAAIAAGQVTHAPCLLDMDATWDSVSCDSAPPLSAACGDAGVP
jgi:hypothetical protein